MNSYELWERSTAYATSAYNSSMRAASAQLDSAVNSANQLYILAAKTAGSQAARVGSEQALRIALKRLGEQGISVSTYTRKDGAIVHTPVDVGVRRMINDELRQRNIREVAELAKELGRKYVEVSITVNCRESHEPWQGQIYSLDPDDDTYPYFYKAVNYGDPVDGFGGYNCGHQIHIYRPEVGRTFTDPLEGTGYTTEEVRKLTTTQRALENNIRKTKREVECLKTIGLDTTAEQAKLRNYQQQLSTLLKENSAVLTSGGSYRISLNRVLSKLYSAEATIQNYKPTSVVERLLTAQNVAYVPVFKHGKLLTEEAIIKKISGADMTTGSCASLAITYFSNKLGLNVEDFRGGLSRSIVAKYFEEVLKSVGVSMNTYTDYPKSEWKLLQEAANDLTVGKEYLLHMGAHAAVIKKVSDSEGDKIYYLELQSKYSSGWKELNKDATKYRFAATIRASSRYQYSIWVYDFDTADSTALQRLCGYINTKRDDQQKG